MVSVGGGMTGQVLLDRVQLMDFFLHGRDWVVESSLLLFLYGVG